MKRVQRGHVTLKWYIFMLPQPSLGSAGTNRRPVGIWVANLGFGLCGRDTVEGLMRSCMDR